MDPSLCTEFEGTESDDALEFVLIRQRRLGGIVNGGLEGVRRHAPTSDRRLGNFQSQRNILLKTWAQTELGVTVRQQVNKAFKMRDYYQ